MGYAQWVEVTIRNTTGRVLSIKNVHLDYGKFYQSGNKDHELSTEEINSTTIPDCKTVIICSCGRDWSPTGTQGYFEIYDGVTKLGRYTWDCPFGEKWNISIWSRYETDRYITTTSHGSVSSAIGKIVIIVDYFDFPNKWDFYKLRNVEKAFSAVAASSPDYFKCAGTVEGGDLPILAEYKSHIQGAARYKNFQILTHNTEATVADYGSVIVLCEDTKKICYRIDTSEKGFNHPGGCQQIGGYLAVCLEKTSSEQVSRIRFYDLSKISETSLPTLLPPKIVRDDGKAGAVGITTFNENGNDCFMVCVHNGGRLDFYKSNGKDLSDPQCQFTKIFSWDSGSGWENISLVTEADNENVYFIGFRTEELGKSNDDYADLYLVDGKNAKLTKVKTIHYFTQHEAVGLFGVHFRWGAGVQVVSPEQILVIVSPRNLETPQLVTPHDHTVETNVFGPFVAG